jgi:hypothetical protein
MTKENKKRKKENKKEKKEKDQNKAIEVNKAKKTTN